MVRQQADFSCLSDRLRDTAGFLDASIARVSPHGRVLPYVCVRVLSAPRQVDYRTFYIGGGKVVRLDSSPHADELCKSRKTGPRATRGIIARSRWVFNRF